MAGYIYLVGSSKFKWYKIGKSSNATIRVSQLGVLMPFTVEVIAVSKCEAYNQAERMLHEKYAEQRLNGEWFHFNGKTFLDVVSDIQLLGTPVISAASSFRNFDDEALPGGGCMEIKFRKKRKRQYTLAEREVAACHLGEDGEFVAADEYHVRAPVAQFAKGQADRVMTAHAGAADGGDQAAGPQMDGRHRCRATGEPAEHGAAVAQPGDAMAGIAADEGDRVRVVQVSSSPETAVAW